MREGNLMWLKFEKQQRSVGIGRLSMAETEVERAFLLY